MTHDVPHVAILVETATSWGRRIIRGATTYAHDHGPWHLHVVASGTTEPERLPLGWNGDGIIARITTEEFARELKATGLPVVNVSSHDELAREIPRVRIDYQATAVLAYEYFQECRLQCFGYVGPLNDPACRAHADAFRLQASSAEDWREFDLHPFAQQTKDWLEQRGALGEWLSELPKPIGLFTWGTGSGSQVLDVCREKRLSVPNDIAVLADDDDPLLCHASTPPMSAVLHATERIGRLAAEILDAQMTGKGVESSWLAVPPIEVASRGSTETLAVEDRELLRAIAYMREHAYRPVQIKEVADAVPMTRRSLERKFRAVFGRTPLDQIRTLRLAKARELLATTDLSISEVAHRAGFSSAEFMATTFRRYINITPLRYRKQFH